MEKYLHSIRENLHLSPEQEENVIAEIRSHLVEDVKKYTKNGVDAKLAEHMAQKSFGDPKHISQKFRRVHMGFLNTPTRVILTALLLLLPIRFILFFSAAGARVNSGARGLGFDFNLGAVGYILMFADFMIYPFVAMWAYKHLATLTRRSRELWMSIVLLLVAVFGLGIIKYTLPEIIGDTTSMRFIYADNRESLIREEFFSLVKFQVFITLLTIGLPCVLLWKNSKSVNPREQKIKEILSKSRSIIAFAFLTTWTVNMILNFAQYGWCLDNNFVEGQCPTSEYVVVWTFLILLIFANSVLGALVGSSIVSIFRKDYTKKSPS